LGDHEYNPYPQRQGFSRDQQGGYGYIDQGFGSREDYFEGTQSHPSRSEFNDFSSQLSNDQGFNQHQFPSKPDHFRNQGFGFSGDQESYSSGPRFGRGRGYGRKF
jgi:hypothetical protein